MSAAKKAKKSESSDSMAAVNGKLKGKDYERELARLHVELVKLQQWVVRKGLKVCIVFEGRGATVADSEALPCYCHFSANQAPSTHYR